MARRLTAIIRSCVRLADGFIKLDRYEFEIDRHDGGKQIIERDVAHRGHAVGVLGYDPVRDEVVLVNEFRAGCFVAGDPPYTDNLVAGGMSEGEGPLDAAIREMQEEAHLELHEPVLVHPGAYASSGGATEKLALVVGFVDATRAGGVHGNADEAEDILTVVLPADEFLRRVRSAQITDMKTLLAGYWLAEHRERLRTLAH
jgi:ADP-ribose pyrophosphatase